MKDNKKLYETIMNSVSKEVMKAINEGAWGSAPEESDTYWDMSHDLCTVILNHLNKLYRMHKNSIDDLYAIMGLTVELLKANIWAESKATEEFVELNHNFQISYQRLSEQFEDDEKESLEALMNQFNKFMKA